MQFTSVPFLNTTRNMQNNIAELRARLITAQSEAVTGRVEDLREATNGDVGKIFQIEKSLRQSEALKNTLSTVSTEYEFVQMTLTETRTSAADIAVSVDGALGLNDDTALAAAALDAKAELESFFARMNTSVGGKYLFSGAAVDTSPMDLDALDTMIEDTKSTALGAFSGSTVTSFLDGYFSSTGAYQTDVYNGSANQGPDYEVSEGRRIGVDVTPLDDNMMDMIRGLTMIAAVGEMSPDYPARDEVLAEAVELLGSATQATLLKQTELGSTEEEIALLQTRNEATTLTFELHLAELLGRDQTEASTEMKNIETQLQAAYLATATMANLSIVNYLR